MAKYREKHKKNEEIRGQTKKRRQVVGKTIRENVQNKMGTPGAIMINADTNTRTNTYIEIYANTDVCMRTCVCVCERGYVYTYICVRVCVCACVCACVCKRARRIPCTQRIMVDERREKKSKIVRIVSF